MLANDKLKSMESMKKEFAEAYVNGNMRLVNVMIENIIALEVEMKEDSIYKKIENIKNSFNTEIDLEIGNEDVIRQNALVEYFGKRIKEIYVEKKNSAKNHITVNQISAILAGMRDRVGIEPTEEQENFVKSLNINQASSIINLLKGISFYNQRQIVTNSVYKMKNRDDYAEILAEVYNNICKKEWFDMNNEILQLCMEFVEPTDPQIRTIANIAKYIETHEALKEVGINVDEYEERPEDKLYYVFNYDKLRKDIREKFNKQSASNFIQKYGYISNFYEGNKLDREELKHLRGLYMQLGEYDCTKTTYLATITKKHYDTIVRHLESQVRYNKIAQNESNRKYAEAMKVTASKDSTVRDFRLTKEQQDGKDLFDFVKKLYTTVGQEVPEEMKGLLPYFIRRGEIVYAGVEEPQIKSFRQLVLEQRNIIKKVNPYFNWGKFIVDQPEHILDMLGFSELM